jgi:hypothetical protein
MPFTFGPVRFSMPDIEIDSELRVRPSRDGAGWIPGMKTNHKQPD